MDSSMYQVQYVLKVYADRLKSQKLNTATSLIVPTVAQHEVELSSEGKKKQLVAQVLSRVVGLLTTQKLEQDEVKAAEDSLHAILPEERRR